MANILCISSHTTRGYVGGSAARIALEALGHQVWLLPTVILSNHPGHASFAGERMPPGRLQAMLDALAENGWLGEVGALQTGYLPTPEHVGFAVRALAAVTAANREAILLCDPILGDDPDGLYIDEAAATALREQLAPRATVLTPNRFELEWLTGTPVSSPLEARNAASALSPGACLVTSLRSGDGSTISNLLAVPSGAWRTDVAARDSAPHGTGDLMAALYLGHVLNGAGEASALALATAGVEAALEVSGPRDELQLPGSRQDWAAASPWPVGTLAPEH